MGEIKPRAYPKTDATETRAITVFRGAIDDQYVKFIDLKERDKQPNIDGVLELVDDERLPIGTLAVQVKTIPPGSHSYSCDLSLLAYANKTTLPLLLVCVDIEAGHVYWRHIARTNPLGKRGAKTTTLRFDVVHDAIGEGCQYLSEWRMILQDYHSRIDGTDVLRDWWPRKRHGESPILTIDTERVAWLQRLIDHINSKLDGEYATIKSTLFPGVWKLAMAVHWPHEDGIVYGFVPIKYGDQDFMIWEVREPARLIHEHDRPGRSTRHALGWNSRPSPQSKDPLAIADEHLWRWFADVVDRRIFGVNSTILCNEILFSFATKYRVALAMDPGESLSVSSLGTCFYQYLPHWIMTAIQSCGNSLSRSRDQLGMLQSLAVGSGRTDTIGVVVRELAQDAVPHALAFSVRSQPDLLTVHDALQYAERIGIETIRRPSYLTDFNNQEQVVERTMRVIRLAHEALDSLLESCSLDRRSFDPFFDSDKIIYAVHEVPESARKDPGVILQASYECYVLEHIAGHRPQEKLDVLRRRDWEDYWGSFYGHDEREVEYEGSQYHLRSISGNFSGVRLDQQPVVDFLYALLEKQVDAAFGRSSLLDSQRWWR